MTFEEEFEIVRQHTILLAYEWKFYQDLYGTEKSVAILNSSAPHFFRKLQMMYVDSIILQSAKLLEAKETGRNGSNKNLSIDYLVSKCNTSDETRAEMTEKRLVINTRFDTLKPYRNKNIAHFDRQTTLNQVNHLPPDTYTLIKDIVSSMFELMNEIQITVNESSTAYEHVISNNGTNSLLMNLIRGDRYTELVADGSIDSLDFVMNCDERLPRG